MNITPFVTFILVIITINMINASSVYFSSYIYIYIQIWNTHIYIYIYIHTRLYRLYICIYNDYIDICVTISDMMSSSISKCQALRLRGLVLLAVGSPGKVRVLLVAFAQYIERIQYIVVHIYIYNMCVQSHSTHTHNTHRSIYIYIQMHWYKYIYIMKLILWKDSTFFFLYLVSVSSRQTPEVAALLGLWNSTSFVGNGLPGAP